jgi:hypothetical protein
MTDVVTRPPAVTTPDPFAGPATERRASTLRPPSLTTLFTLLFGFAGWYLGFSRLGDNSFLWHLRTGHHILEHGVPRHDVFSFSAPGVKWIAQSWLAEAAYAVDDNVAGGFGVRLLVACTGAAVMVAVYRIALRIAGNRVRAAGITCVALATMLNVWSERPLLLGLAGVIALVWAVEMPESFLGRHVVVALPLVMWGWANVHGSFALGYGYVALHLIGRAADGASLLEGRERKVLIATAISVPLLLVNPYGFGLVWFPVALMKRGDMLQGVQEWSSPDFGELGGMLYAAWIAVVVVGFVRQRPSRRDVIVGLPFLFLGLWAIRNVGIAALVTVPVAARAFTKERREAAGDEPSPVAWAYAAILVLLCVFRLNGAASEPDYDFSKYPVKAMQAAVRLEGTHARLLSTDAWSGYAIWRYDGSPAVFMDDRYDMYPRPVNAAYNTMADVTPGWQKTLDRWKVDVVVWPRERALSQALALTPEWRLAYHDKLAAVYVRN